MEELSYVLTQYFVSCVHVRFYFSLQLIFTLLAASISHFLDAPSNFHVFLPMKFVSFVSNNLLQLFPISVKNNVGKDMTLLLFFLYKSPGSHVISFQIKPWVAFGLPDLLTELFTLVCLWCGRTVERSVGWCTVTWKNLKKKRHVRVLHSFKHLTSNTTRELTNWRLSHDATAGSRHSSAFPSCRNLNLRFVVKTTTILCASGKFSHRFWSLFSSFHK